MVNVNLYHVTKFSNNLSFIVHDFYLKIVVLRHFFHKNCFGQFLSAYFLFWEILNLKNPVCRLPAVILNLCIDRHVSTANCRSSSGDILLFIHIIHDEQGQDMFFTF